MIPAIFLGLMVTGDDPCHLLGLMVTGDDPSVGPGIGPSWS